MSSGTVHNPRLQAEESTRNDINFAHVSNRPVGWKTLDGKLRTAPATRQHGSVLFTLQIDRTGSGEWLDYQTGEVPAGGYVAHLLPDDLDAVWLRLKSSRDCVATAYLHQTTARFIDGEQDANQKLFAGVADIHTAASRASLLYPAKRNRDLRVITSDDRYFDFTKVGFDFEAARPDVELAGLLRVEPEFTVDDASVVVKHRGQTLRLPKGDATRLPKGDATPHSIGHLHPVGRVASVKCSPSGTWPTSTEHSCKTTATFTYE